MTTYPIQAIILRTDLNMGFEQRCSQIIDASLRAILSLGYYNDEQSEIIIRLEQGGSALLDGNLNKVIFMVHGEQPLLQLAQQARQAGLAHGLVASSGEHGELTTYTTLAIGPGLCEDIHLLTQGLAPIKPNQ